MIVVVGALLGGCTAPVDSEEDSIKTEIEANLFELGINSDVQKLIEPSDVSDRVPLEDTEDRLSACPGNCQTVYYGCNGSCPAGSGEVRCVCDDDSYTYCDRC